MTLVFLGKNTSILYLLIGFSICQGCEEKTPDPPLRPLIYTEQPEKDPRLAEIRESRFLREYEGRGEQKNKKKIQTPTSFEMLGQAIFKRLVERNTAPWEALWVDSFLCASESGLTLAEAEEQRDLAILNSKPLWMQFDPGKPSERSDTGLGSILEFKAFHPGRKEKGITADHYFENILELELKEAQQIIRIPIPEVIVEKGQFGLISALPENEELAFLRELGLHLRADLQDSAQYLLPLKVGNYWRYRLTERADDLTLPDIFEEGLSNQEGASTKTVEVISIDRLGVRRLVRFRVSYDDEQHSTFEKAWLTTPTRIFRCEKKCREHFQSLAELLPYLKKQRPIFQNPIPSSKDIKVPMGQFNHVLIYSIAPFEDEPETYLRFPQKLYLKPHIGIIRREVEREEKPFELLINYRLLP